MFERRGAPPSKGLYFFIYFSVLARDLVSHFLPRLVSSRALSSLFATARFSSCFPALPARSILQLCLSFASSSYSALYLSLLVRLSLSAALFYAYFCLAGEGLPPVLLLSLLFLFLFAHSCFCPCELLSFASLDSVEVT